MTRTVLITGCSSGIGQALAEAFCADGARVIATARNPAALADLEAMGCLTMPLDVSSGDSRAALLARLDALGIKHLDVLINNAGISAMGPILELPEDKLRAQFETNVIAPALLVQVLFSRLQQARAATIVNVGSVSGVLTTPFAGAYCASKSALHSLSDAMRMECAPFGVRVVLIQPGAIQSRFGESAAKSVTDWFDERSRYAPIRDGIMARAMASQNKATDARRLAAEVVRALVARHPKPVLRIGRGSRTVPMLRRYLSLSATDRILSKRFRLNVLNARPPESA